MKVETQLNIGIREIQKKIDKLEWFVDQVSQYFTDSLQVLGLAIQGATQLSQVLVDSEGNYSTDGIDMSWSAKMKAQKIQTVSKSDYRTPQEQTNHHSRDLFSGSACRCNRSHCCHIQGRLPGRTGNIVIRPD